MPEPPYFDEEIRRRGQAVIAVDDDKLPPYWQKCLLDLWRSYGGICAYLCVHIPRGTGGRSVDHFAPKSKNPALAYEWSNFRLCCTLMNARKRDFEDVLDPFEIATPPFQLDFPSMGIAPAAGLIGAERERAQETIRRLKLDDQECREARKQYYAAFLKMKLPLEYLDEFSPFVALEYRRRNAGSPLPHGVNP